MAKDLAKVESNGLWRGHLRVKGTSPVPSESEYDAWKMHDTGISIPDIAEVNGITEATVRKAVKKVEKFFESRVSLDVAALKMRQHARLEALIETALEDYQESGGKVTTSHKKMVPAADGMPAFVKEETITEKQMTRDPRFLSTVMAALDSQRKIWPGMNAPSASSIHHEAGGEVKISVECVAKMAANLTDEEVAALEKLDKMLDEEDMIDV